MRLMSVSALRNETHHIDRFTDGADADRFTRERRDVKTLEDAAFYEWLGANLGDPGVTSAATAMLLHDGLLDQDTAEGTETVTLRERTDGLLARLGFKWSEVSPDGVWSLVEPHRVPPPRPSMRPSEVMRVVPPATT
jgi:hypothetical protein